MRVVGRGRMRGLGAVLVAGALLVLPAGGATAQTVDCTAPDLARVDAELVVAQAAVVAGNAAALQAAVDSARAQLDAIAAACWEGTASPAPSLGPVDLGGSATVGGRTVRYPGDLVVIEDGLLEPVDEGDLRADVLTVADSLASGELLRSQPEPPLPPGFRVISLAVGDPAAAIGALNGASQEVPPGGPLGALQALAASVEADANDEAPIVFRMPVEHTFPDGSGGAAVDLTVYDAEGTEFLSGIFLLRPLPDGDWALGVALASADGIDAVGAELAATLLAIGEPG